LSGEPWVGDTVGMLPEDGHSESVREDKPGTEGVRDAAGEEGARASAPKPDGIRIDGRIGTDTEELKRWADHVVAGNAIEHMEIADLRALIEAVQAHPEAAVQPETDDRLSASTTERPNAKTRLSVRGGFIAACNAWELRVRVPLVVSSSLWGDTVRFEKAVFTSGLHLEDAVFVGEASFRATIFGGGTSFHRVLFRGAISFRDAVFEGPASFEQAFFVRGMSFRGARFRDKVSFRRCVSTDDAWFDRAEFADEAWFDRAQFQGKCVFLRSVFMDEANFDRATFEGENSFMESAFLRSASFVRAQFHGPTFFGLAAFRGVAALSGSCFASAVIFDRCLFEDTVSLEDARFQAVVSCDEVVWGGRVRCNGASISQEAFGDFRGVDVSKANASLRRSNSSSRPLRLVAAPALSLVRSLRYGWPGWERVRATGGLTIINRVSVVTLFAVPVLAAFYVGAQSLVAKHGTTAGGAPWWMRSVVASLSEDPHLSASVAFAFFASVAISLGLLIYQSNAPQVIKKRDEDEHVRDVEERYSDENKSMRRDGLRRSIERLEDQGRLRAGRHPRFVRHHGVLIWIPPGDKPEWFDDKTLPTEEDFRERLAARAKTGNELSTGEAAPGGGTVGSSAFVPIQNRPGFVPDFERARICIEEGARAEYWLKAHESIFAAWVSFVCYAIGILMLFCVVVIQCHNVGRAAGWWPGVDPKPYLRAWFGL
jgi:uncharacterized protein YjbI with pentapeptide repeats